MKFERLMWLFVICILAVLIKYLLIKVIYGRIRSFYLVEFVPYYQLLVVFDFVPFVFFLQMFWSFSDVYIAYQQGFHGDVFEFRVFESRIKKLNL